MVTLDLHAPQIQGFLRIPVDVLYGLPVLCKAIQRKKLENLVVVSPDAGFAKQARKYAAYLGAPLAIAVKERRGHDEKPQTQQIIGMVKGKTALIVDDFTLTAETLVQASKRLVEQGAKSVYAAVTHGVFTKGSMEKINKSPIEFLLVTDSIETQPVKFSPKIEVVSVAPLLAEAIKRIHKHQSISVLLPD